MRPPGLTRGVAQQTLSKTVPKSRALASPVCDVADDTHRKGSIDSQYFFGINTDLALARHDRPIDLVVVLPGFDLGDVRYLVRLILNWQVLRPTDDRPWRHLRMNPDRDAKAPIQGERIVIELNDPMRSADIHRRCRQRDYRTAAMDPRRSTAPLS